MISPVVHITQFLRTFIVRLTLFALILNTSASLTFALDPETMWNNYVTLSSGRALFNSPAIADIDGDSSNGKEVVVASNEGLITALRADGSTLWTASAPDSQCDGRSKIHSSPRTGDLLGNGNMYVVVGYGGFSKRCQGGVIALDGKTGALFWNFSTKDFSKKQKFWAILHNVFSTPAVADTDGDGVMEVGFGSFDRNVYLLNGDGSVRWYYNAADTVWSSPVFANIDSTPQLEMIIGTDISQNKLLKPPTKNGGNLYAFKTAKNPKLKYGFRDKAAFVWMKPVEQVLFSTPAVGDVMPQNPGLEVVINSGCYFPERTNKKVGKWTRVFSASNGKLLRTLPINACSSSSPALGDLDNDGVPEIVVTANGAAQVGGDGFSRITAFKPSTSTQLWSIIPYFKGHNYNFGGNFISPVIADLNGDGTKEVIAPVHSGLGVYEGSTGVALTCESGNCGTALPSLSTGDVIVSSPTVGDINNDGVADVVVVSKKDGSGAVYGWTGF